MEKLSGAKDAVADNLKEAKDALDDITGGDAVS